MQKTARRRIRTGLLAVIGIASAGAWLPIAAAGTLPSPGCLDGGNAATVTAVDEALNLHLVDGRLVRLAGIHADAADRPTGMATPQNVIGAWLRDARVRVAPVRGDTDRWGRTVALVFAPGAAGSPVSVGEAVLDAGLATAEPDPALASCWVSYLQLEDAARRAHAGLWADPDAVIGPADRPALTRRLGSWTLVEGHVGRVQDGRARTYLRFSESNGSGLALAIDRASVRRLVETLGSTDGWVGRRLLARGLLDDRWGLQIDISSPQQIRLDPP